MIEEASDLHLVPAYIEKPEYYHKLVKKFVLPFSLSFFCAFLLCKCWPQNHFLRIGSVLKFLLI